MCGPEVAAGRVPADEVHRCARALAPEESVAAAMLGGLAAEGPEGPEEQRARLGLGREAVEVSLEAGHRSPRSGPRPVVEQNPNARLRLERGPGGLEGR